MAADRIEVLVATEHDGVPRILEELAQGTRAQPMGAVATVAELTAPRKRGAPAARQPDVVVVELLTLESVAQLPALARLAPVVVVSSVPAELALVPCMAAGAQGFVAKEEMEGVLDDAVAAVAAGRTYMGPASTAWLVADAVSRRGPAAARGSGRRPAEQLSERQVEVLDLVGKGLTNAEVAVALGMSANSVKTHLHRAMRKLGVNHREAAADAVKQAAPTRRPRPRAS